MDNTSIFIIVIATLAALVFKYVMFKKICRWMDNDMAKGLAAGHPEKHQYLQEQLDQMRQDKISRKHFPAKLSAMAEEFDRNN